MRPGDAEFVPQRNRFVRAKPTGVHFGDQALQARHEDEPLREDFAAERLKLRVPHLARRLQRFQTLAVARPFSLELFQQRVFLQQHAVVIGQQHPVGGGKQERAVIEEIAAQRGRAFD